MNSEQKTFSTKSLTMPAIAIMLSAGAILNLPAIAISNETYTPQHQHNEGINHHYTPYIQVGSITSSSGEVEIVKNKLYQEEERPWLDFEIDPALNLIQKLSFLKVDEEIDRKIDNYFGSKPLNSKKIFIAKHNR
ncbi:hypothetical protein KKF97_19420 [Myxococcota bacterium]|nr:hypothetical protein [Myxococcota bacterium]MBU1379375.1 hypothetical protein [Myxococcota bacterium]